MNSDKIKSIGIITHRGNYNYGGLFQALALQRLLSSLGFNVEIINLNKMQLSGSKAGRIIRALLTPINTFKKIIKSKREQQPPECFMRIFMDFKESIKMKYSSEVLPNTIGKITKKYDAIIVGSDQVWCYKYARPLIFFIQWKPVYNGRMLSYAACSPDMDIPWYNKGIIKKQLMQFDEISVRDVNTQQWVQTICNRKPLVVADPTLLYDFEDVVGLNKINEPYIFTYCLGSEICGGHDTVIKEIRKRYGAIRVIGIAIPNKSKEVEKFADEVIYDASPKDWLTLIKYATFVYTDSFHGCMFSLKFKKQFIAYYAQESRASRLIDIRDRYGLENAIVSSVSELQEQQCIQNGINYETTNSLMQEHIDLSKQFLIDSLCLTNE